MAEPYPDPGRPNPLIRARPQGAIGQARLSRGDRQAEPPIDELNVLSRPLDEATRRTPTDLDRMPNPLPVDYPRDDYALRIDATRTRGPLVHHAWHEVAQRGAKPPGATL